MKSNNPGKRPVKLAAALGAILITGGCVASTDPMFAGLPKNLDGGIGQLLRYCSKFQDTGDLVTAASLCDRAHQMEPKNPAPLMQLADILNGLNQPNQAMAAYQRIIDASPQYTDARYALGKMHIARGEYDVAAAQFQTALRYNSDDPRLYNALGVAHGLIGANGSAMHAFEDGLKIAPRHIALRNNMGLALVMNGSHEDGVRMLEEVVADPAANDASHHNLQLAYGMVTAAKADQEAFALEQAAALEQATALEQAANVVTQESSAPIEAVTTDSHSQVAAAVIPAPQPVPLVPEPEMERSFATIGESETPFDVTIRETFTLANRSDESPMRVQTALANTGSAMDANVEDTTAASAYMGAYLTADAEISTAPATAPATPMATVQSELPTQVAALQSMAPAMSSGNYAVQLASYRSEARAMLGWSELRGNAPDLLDPISPVVQRAELGADIGTVYRLRTTPTAKSDAATLCSELKARGIDCLVIKEAPSGSNAGSIAG
jgi:Flp pilus assembly protein TadD